MTVEAPHKVVTRAISAHVSTNPACPRSEVDAAAQLYIQ